MSMHASILVDSVGPPSAEVCCHIPKFWIVKINKIGTMYVCID
jgi:hypothetical protein